MVVPYYDSSYYGDNAKIVAKSGDEFFFENGAILKGGIMAEDIQDVKIYGRGIIDITNYPKQYDTDKTPGQ